jgi:hypothetical protein
VRPTAASKQMTPVLVEDEPSRVPLVESEAPFAAEDNEDAPALLCVSPLRKLLL